MTNARHLSLSSDHFTPREVVEAARVTMGGIDLDPASCALANSEIVKATRWFGPGGKVENGFTTGWAGKVFLNPPGGKAWWFKLAAEWIVERVEQAIFVGFSLEILQVTQTNPTVTGKGQSLLPVPLDFPMCFPKRRIAYLKRADEFDLLEIANPQMLEEAKRTGLVVDTSPPHASVLVWLPPRNRTPADTARFVAAFQGLGRCVIPRAEAER